MTSEKGSRKDKNQNIQVFVRLRPLNKRELDIKSLGVIEVLHNREVVVRQSQQSTFTKKFTFDRAFGPNAKQVEIYQEVVSPLIEEVLAGYNCTVFAYGQTGTGKTHTMVGDSTSDSDSTNWQNDPSAGIIPRALSQLFDELRISATEHTVRVSYLELYNEELFDLLSTSEDNSKLRIYEDVTRKGSNIVNGLEEITVSNKNEVYRIMAQGQERKRVASTLMNAQSSRSHTVFTIVVHMKENSPEGEELVKIGKLNLVDLAGSENISKAGSDNPAKKERARECVNINQSLLTLGRVITALVEKHPHIPYRESKLTRILQESLGGRTKTSIIATISPGHKDLEETMSTLEYANRAKNIQNKPEVNQKMTKKAILRQYAEEIDRLKKDLQAARDKNGVFLSSETYTELTLKQEEQKKEIQELLLQKRATEEQKDKMETVFLEANRTLEAKQRELARAATRLASTVNMLRTTKLESEERAHLIEKQQETETTLSAQARRLVSAADTASQHARALHDTVARRRNIEANNLQVTRTYREQSSEQRDHITAGTRHFKDSLVENLNGLHDALETFNTSSTDTLHRNKSALDQLVANISQMMHELKSLSVESHRSVSSSCEAHRAALAAGAGRRRAAAAAACAALLRAVAACARAASEHQLPDQLAGLLEHWHASARDRVASLQRSHVEFTSRMEASWAAGADAARAHRQARRAHLDARAKDINNTIAEIEAEKADLESRLSQQQADIAAERSETEDRLARWVEQERRLFEQRLQDHVRSEMEAMEHRLSKKAQELSEEKSRMEARISRHLESHRSLLAACAEEVELAGREEVDSEAADQRTRGVAGGYGQEFGDGTAALAAELGALCADVAQGARRLHAELVDALRRADAQMQEDTRAFTQQDEEAGEQFLAETAAALAKLVQDHRAAVDSVLATLEANSTTSISSLSSVSADTEGLISSARHHTTSLCASVRDAAALATSFQESISATVARQAELEDKHLGEEYKLYAPTGSTPARAEYRYPRALAATSPHERILERYRAARGDNRDDDDCILVESEPECRGSDGESSLSEDSAVFAAPSPPAPPAPRAVRGDAPKHNLGIVKCTSESDIYNIKRKEEQGKENADNSLTNGGYKKPSKLRAPSSHKKPLVERSNCNTYN